MACATAEDPVLFRAPRRGWSRTWARDALSLWGFENRKESKARRKEFSRPASEAPQKEASQGQESERGDRAQRYCDKIWV